MNTAGPKVDGAFAEVMGVVGPYWHGFKNENIKLENIMVDALDPSWATWETLQDVTGPTGVVQKDMKFGHKFHFNADGKVDAWQMIFDSKLVEEMKGSSDRAAAPTATFQMNTAGPKVDGAFAEVMGVVGPYWHGFKNENIKLENIMVDALDPSWATWETLQDVTG